MAMSPAGIGCSAADDCDAEPGVGLERADGVVLEATRGRSNPSLLAATPAEMSVTKARTRQVGGSDTPPIGCFEV